MENDVLPGPSRDSTRNLASRSVDRSLERRRVAYAAEVRDLVQASLDVIRRTGCLEPTVGEIVRAAGSSNKAFYRHFRSKDELLLTVLDDGIGRLGDYLRHQIESADSPLDRVRAWIAGVIEQALNAESAGATRPFALSRARLSELFPDEVRQSESQLTELLCEAIRAAAEAGEVRSDEPERDAALVYNLAMGWVERRLAETSAPDRSEAEHLVEFAMRGLRGGPARRG
jgi:AcrR family transcriptional regulator